MGLHSYDKSKANFDNDDDDYDDGNCGGDGEEEEEVEEKNDDDDNSEYDACYDGDAYVNEQHLLVYLLWPFCPMRIC